MTEPKRCRATNRQGEQCKRPPMRGGKVCASHGGKVPNVLRASQRRLAEQEAEAKAIRSVERLTGERAPTSIGDVYRELLDTAGLVVAWKDVLRERVDTLSDYTSTTALGGEQIRGDVLLFERAMDRSLKVLEAVARLDLDSRLTRLNAEQLDVMERAIRKMLDGLDLTPEQRERIPVVVPQAFRDAGSEYEARGAR